MLVPLLEAFWLLHVNLLLEVGVQESGINVRLLNVEIVPTCQLEKQAECGEADSWTESVKVV